MSIADRQLADAIRALAMDGVEAAFQRAGLRVARNTPCAGAFIAQSYGRPSARRHVIQVEIDRGLYMDEATITPHPGFEAFRRLMAGVIAEIVGIGRASLPLAAE